tara:strand:+ start:2206 stop:2436 length:231 start_codon:yes stop_codon:yes gene_type:complete
MSFIAKIFGMEPPEMESPPIEDTPSFEDEQRELEQKRLLEDQERKKKGRRSTILTGGQGLNEIEDDNIDKKNLLGG